MRFIVRQLQVEHRKYVSRLSRNTAGRRLVGLAMVVVIHAANLSAVNYRLNTDYIIIYNETGRDVGNYLKYDLYTENEYFLLTQPNLRNRVCYLQRLKRLESSMPRSADHRNFKNPTVK